MSSTRPPLDDPDQPSRPTRRERVRTVVRPALQVDRGAAQPAVAVPYALGFGAVLLAGVLMSEPLLGVVAASGAINAGGLGVDPQIARPRLTMLVTTAVLSSSLFVACLVSDHPLLAVLTLAAIGAVVGLLSPREGPGQVGVQAVVGFLAMGQQATPLRTALTYAGLVAVGGLVQVMIGTLVGPRSRRRRSRVAVVLRRELPGPERAEPAPLPEVRRAVFDDLRHPGPESCWHALRLGLGLGVAEALSQLLLPLRGYWVPLTVVNVLQPRLTDTIARGLDRLLGTAVGVAAGGGAVVLARPEGMTLLALGTLLAWAMFALQSVNYFFYTTALTAWVVVFLEVMGIGAQGSVPQRLLATAAGGILSLVLVVLVRGRGPR